VNIVRVRTVLIVETARKDNTRTVLLVEAARKHSTRGVLVELRTSKGRQWSGEGVRPVGASYSEKVYRILDCPREPGRDFDARVSNPVLRGCSVRGRNWISGCPCWTYGFRGLVQGDTEGQLASNRYDGGLRG
jgi:hypothetical protein